MKLPIALMTLLVQGACSPSSEPARETGAQREVGTAPTTTAATPPAPDASPGAVPVEAARVELPTAAAPSPTPSPEPEPAVGEKPKPKPTPKPTPTPKPPPPPPDPCPGCGMG